MSARRRLGTPSLAAIVVANMVGAGVFTTSGFALADLGSRGLVLTAWAVGGVLALLGALCYGALAAHLRESGGEYLFLSRTLHPVAGFLAGWISLWAGFTGAIALAAETVQTYLADWLPAGFPPDLLGSALIVIAGVLHAVRVAPGARAQNVAVAVKLVLLTALTVWGAWVIGQRGVPAGALDAAADGAVGNAPAAAAQAVGLGAFVTTLMWISLSYSGWNAAVYVAGEARDPQRTLPRALLLGTVAVTLLYLGWNGVLVGAAPVAELAGQQDIGAVAAQALGGDTLAGAVRILLALALWTSISSMVMIGPRVYAQMAEDGCLPRTLAFRGEAPRAAIVLQVVLAVAVLWASGLREQLTNLGWILGLSTAAAVAGLLRERARVGREALRIPGGPAVAWLFLLATLALVGVMVAVRVREVGPALAVLGSGLVVAWWTRRRQATGRRS